MTDSLEHTRNGVPISVARAYLLDPEFHAAVHTAERAVKALYGRTGGLADTRSICAVALAAALRITEPL
jgi:hypothetical protein